MNGSRVSRAPLRRCSTSWVAAALAAAVALLIAVPQTQAAATQLPQPRSGPGGSNQPHAGVRVTSGGSGVDAWYVFEPTRPRPVSAPLAVITHGYGEFAGYDSMSALIRHTVLAGNVVISTRWQTAIATPCPGPIDIEPCMASEVKGIKGALAYLHAHKRRVQPDVHRTSYFGFSFGGIITANLANRYRQLGVPRPRAIFLDDPHDGGLTGAHEPALDADLGGIPATTLVECHSGCARRLRRPVHRDRRPHRGRPAEEGRELQRRVPQAHEHPREAKSLVLTSEDHHGRPALTSDHGVCAGSTAGGHRAAPTPTTGGSAGRSSTRCAAAPTPAPPAGTRWEHPGAPLHRHLERRRADHRVEGPASRPHPRRARTPAPARSACGPAARRTT